MKKKNSSLLCGFFLLLFVFLIIFTTSSSNFAQEFSAKIKITQPEETYNYDYFVKNHLYRLEGQDSFGEPIVIIANRQEDTYLGLHPIMKFYMEFTREEMFLFNPIIGWEMITEGYQEEKAGIEMVNGFQCAKYIYTREGVDGFIEAWYSPELKQRIKVIIPLIHSEQSTFELLNIQVGNQNERYFKVPEDYEKMASMEDLDEKIQSETNARDDITSDSNSNILTGEAPIGRTLTAGEILKVYVNPSLGKNLVIENKSADDASIVITPFQNNQPLNNQITEKTITSKRKTRPDFSSSLNIDLIEIKVNEGTVLATVVQESFFTDEIERNEYYLFENFGQGLFFSENKQVKLTIIGDNETSGISLFEITFFKGEYQDSIEKLELSLQKGESKQWEFQPGEVKTADIVTGGSNGGVKIILEQLPL
jgi:hypothetical protein